MEFYRLFRPILFSLDPETVHNLTLRLLELAGVLPSVRAWLRRIFTLKRPDLRVHAFGLDFVNPVGMAAGYDKNGRAIFGMACLGFGHLELGTVTPYAQVGNPRPRVFRLPEDEALINRMGFPNEGAEALLRRLQKGCPNEIVVGVNIGKGMVTPLDRAVDDYMLMMRMFYPHADYLVVNVSSPNTLGLRRLQAREYLGGLLGALSAARQELQSAYDRRVPILVKLAPDLTDRELEDAIGSISETGMEGVIATNTTIKRPGLRSRFREETGGLSGVPMRKRSTEVVRRIHTLTNGRLPIIGAGGIFGPDDAREKLDAGAVLIQVYTGLIYQGPSLVRVILEGL